MEEFKKITTHEIERKLDGEYLRVNRILSMALVGGSLVFLLMSVYFYLNNSMSNANSDSATITGYLIMIFIPYALVMYGLSFYYPAFYLKDEKLHSSLTQIMMDHNNVKIDDPVVKILSLDRTMMIIRLAFMEGITLFSLVILFLTVSNSLIYDNSVYWLFSLPWLIQFLITLLYYVPKEKFVDRIENQILMRIRKMA